MDLKLPVPHAKQADFLADAHRYQVLNWGRRCFAKGTPVLLADGSERSIEDIVPGDEVISYNRLLDAAFIAPVVQRYKFGVDKNPKPMVELVVNGNTTTSTYDHEYYVDNEWVPAIELAWGSLAPSERQKFQLLCKQYGTVIDDELQGRLSDPNNQARLGRVWVFKDGTQRQDNQGTPRRGGDVAQKPAAKATGKPHQQYSDRQPDRESRMGDAGGEPRAHDAAGSPDKKLRRAVRDAQAQGEGCAHDSGVPGVSCRCFKLSIIERTGTPLSSSETGLDQGYFEGQNLEVSAAAIRGCEESYDLEVTGTHNYVANGLLVSNTGKSVAVWEKVVFQAMIRQGTYYIIAPTYKQAKSIYWRDIIKRYRGGFMTFNEQELSVTFDHIGGFTIPMVGPDGEEFEVEVNHDPDLPPSRIELKGADNPDSLRGTGISGAVLDEYAFMPDGKYLYDTILSASLADRDGWCVFISTPNGMHNHFYDLVKLAQANPDIYYYSHATAQDNQYFPIKEFENARRQHELEGKVEQWNQEWLAEFTNPQKLIYKNFDANIHVLPGRDFDSKMPEFGTKNIGIDFGMTDPTAAVFVHIDLEGNWWIYDEIYETDLDLDPLVFALRNKMGDDRFTRIIGDSRGRFEIESLRRRRFRITGSKKGADSIVNGIHELQALLYVREGSGLPKLFIRSSCKNTIREFESYSWETDDKGEILDNRPEDKFNHALDALRYLALDKINPVTKTKRKREWDEVTGRALN